MVFPITYIGFIPETDDAMTVIEAVANNNLPLVTERPSAGERYVIHSGSVFVFESTAIQRWTDGRIWTASRAVGNFYIYRELIDRSTIIPGHREDISEIPFYPRRNYSSELNLYGVLDSRYNIKHHGLIKRTFSVHHVDKIYRLVSYYTVDDVMSNRLSTPLYSAPMVQLPVPQLVHEDIRSLEQEEYDGSV